jgi:uncharacterized protein
MKNAVIIHGSPDEYEYYDSHSPASSNHHWLPWLQKQLMMRDYLAHTPEMPYSFRPDYSLWRREFERFDINQQTALIGHSCGGGFITRWLSENRDVKVGRVVLVAPWLDPNDRKSVHGFFHFEMDPDMASRARGLILFSSNNDGQEVMESVSIIRNTLHNLDYREFPGYGHFCVQDLHSHEFPQLLEAVVDQP